MRPIKDIFQVTFLLATLFLFAPQVYANPLGDKEVALFKAIDEGNIQTVESLLEQGVDLELRDPTTEATPLMIAFQSFIMGTQDSQVMKALINVGADVDAKDRDGGTLLGMAIFLNSAEFRRMAGNGGQFHLIQQQNCIKAIEILLDAGADTEEITPDGVSPLLSAIEYGSSIEAIRLLIENGADVNAENHIGETALILAKEADNAEVVEILLLHGAVEYVE